MQCVIRFLVWYRHFIWCGSKTYDRKCIQILYLGLDLLFCFSKILRVNLFKVTLLIWKAGEKMSITNKYFQGENDIANHFGEK
jgi:hypothetical protein